MAFQSATGRKPTTFRCVCSVPAFCSMPECIGGIFGVNRIIFMGFAFLSRLCFPMTEVVFFPAMFLEWAVRRRAGVTGSTLGVAAGSKTRGTVLLYNEAPTSDISVEEFDRYARDRIELLQALERARTDGKKREETRAIFDRKFADLIG